MTPNSEGVPGENRISSVMITNIHSADEYVLYPSDATDEELQTMWVRATVGDYTYLKDMQ